MTDSTTVRTEPRSEDEPLAEWGDLQARPFDPHRAHEPRDVMIAGDGYRIYRKTSEVAYDEPELNERLAELLRASRRGEYLHAEVHDLDDRWGLRWTRHAR